MRRIQTLEEPQGTSPKTNWKPALAMLLIFAALFVLNAVFDPPTVAQSTIEAVNHVDEHGDWQPDTRPLRAGIHCDGTGIAAALDVGAIAIAIVIAAKKKS